MQVKVKWHTGCWGFSTCLECVSLPWMFCLFKKMKSIKLPNCFTCEKTLTDLNHLQRKSSWRTHYWKERTWRTVIRSGQSPAQSQHKAVLGGINKEKAKHSEQVEPDITRNTPCWKMHQNNPISSMCKQNGFQKLPEDGRATSGSPNRVCHMKSPIPQE